MRTIGVVSVGRSDVGLYRPILQALRAAPDIVTHLYLTGAHLSPRHGGRAAEVEKEFPVFDRIDSLLASDTPEGVAKSMGLGVMGFAASFARHRPDILLVLGDRFEMHAAALAALPFRIPVAHIHGGELTAGAIDDALRHSITKLSHLHFVSHVAYGRRIIQMGEEPWRVVHAGAPALDALASFEAEPPEVLRRMLDLPGGTRPLVVTFHPETLRAEETARHVEELLAALAETGLPVVFTMPNADTANATVRNAIEGYVVDHPGSRAVTELGTRGYFGLMTFAAAMVGNSSSGILEATSFELPVVNIGERQAGRLRAENVLDVPHERKAILDAIQRATSPEFRERMRGIRNPYAKVGASATIVERLQTIPIDDRLLIKRFHDLSVVSADG